MMKSNLNNLGRNIFLVIVIIISSFFGTWSFLEGNLVPLFMNFIVILICIIVLIFRKFPIGSIISGGIILIMFIILIYFSFPHGEEIFRIDINNLEFDNGYTKLEFNLTNKPINEIKFIDILTEDSICYSSRYASRFGILRPRVYINENEASIICTVIGKKSRYGISLTTQKELKLLETNSILIGQELENVTIIGYR